MPPSNFYATEQQHRLLEAEDRSQTEPLLKHTSLWARVRVHVILATLYSVLAIVTVFVYNQQIFGNTSSQVATSWPSPATAAVSHEQIQFNGTLTFPSPYKGPPSPEVDELWDQVTMLQPFGISESVVTTLGKDPARSAKMPLGNGDHYLASVEVIHQLHCLNLLRQHTYYDYYKDIVFKLMGTRDQQQVHLDHCVDLLRQALMCQSDTGLITYAWVAFADTPMPDFNTMHKCRNFEGIRQWAINEAPDEAINHRKPGEGAYIWGNLP